MNARSVPLIVVTAVHAETRAVLEALRDPHRADTPGLRSWLGEVDGRPVRLVQAGIGPERARRALQTMPLPHAIVVSVGFAGALDIHALPGDVVLPTHVLWDEPGGLQRYEVPAAARRRAEEALAKSSPRSILRGSLFSSALVLAEPRDKLAARERTGAVAVEMEAAGLIPLANERGAAVLPLRAVLDTADVSLGGLPPNVDESWRARMQLLARPSAWSAVWAVARQIPAATRSLRDALRLVLPAL